VEIALPGGFKGGNGGGPIHRGAVAEHLHRREGRGSRRSLLAPDWN
jgi:hypothetical protein